MKTSSKILTGFIVLIFLVPIFVLMAFKSAIKKGEFTEVKNERYEDVNFRNGFFKPYKVVKMISPVNRSLKCNLQYSDSLYYSYNTLGSDNSIRVYNQGDTLFIRYESKRGSEENMDHHSIDGLYIDLKLPSAEHLIVENAEVNILSTDGSGDKSMDVEIVGKGLLNIGAFTENTDATDTNLSHLPYRLDRLSVKNRNGELKVGHNVEIGQLAIQANGASILNIKDGAIIGEVQGSLSDSASVYASWKYIKMLTALTQ